MNLEKRSFENLVYFYEAELRRILRGKRATSLFSTSRRAGLVKRGVLGSLRGKGPFVTDRAMQVLEDMR